MCLQTCSHYSYWCSSSPIFGQWEPLQVDSWVLSNKDLPVFDSFLAIVYGNFIILTGPLWHFWNFLTKAPGRAILSLACWRRWEGFPTLCRNHKTSQKRSWKLTHVTHFMNFYWDSTRYTEKRKLLLKYFAAWWGIF